MKTTTHTIRKLKGQRPIAAVTAYDSITAKLADEAGIDLILVGDSVGTTLLGFDSTVPVTLAMMVHHTAAVTRVRPRALVVADLPFAEMHFGFDRVLKACQRLVQEAGADAVKIEGGYRIAAKVQRLVDAGVPVCGHVGLQPQQVRRLGRYKRYGMNPDEIKSLVKDATALELAGAFAIVGEMLSPESATTLRSTLKVPLIGIGAGRDCDGQILVSTDVLGLTLGPVPSFATAFAQVGSAVRKGFAAYCEAVKSGSFPE